MKCPCCHGAGHVEGLDAVRMTFTPASTQSAMIIEELLAHPAGVTKSHLLNSLYGLRSDGGPETADNAIGVVIHRARKLLQPFGWTISCLHPTSDGFITPYRLVQIEPKAEAAE